MRLMLRLKDAKLTTPKQSPRHGWKFDYMVAGYGRAAGPPASFAMRFRVYSESPLSEGNPAEGVARMLLRLWDFNVQRLKLDHADAYGDRVIDVYLCKGGKAGGEHRFDVEERDGRRIPVSTIYVYDIASFKQPIEMAREVAHEYGHATLPPVGGFETPEDWANGYLGEKLYLSWLLGEMISKGLSPADAMGATIDDVDAFVRRNVRPLVARTLLNGPNTALLAQKGPAAMDAFLSLALYADAVLPQKAFARSLVLNQKQTALGYLSAVVEAAAESERWVLNSNGLEGQSVWIPLGKGKLTGASGLKRQGDWVQIRVNEPTVTVTNPQP